MAERLAPERAPLQITSRPERPRGTGSRWLRRLSGLTITVVVLAASLVVLAHFLVVEGGAKQLRASALVPEGMPASVLVVVARPGQELPMAGTIRALDAAGARVSMLSLTRGEAQPPDLQSTSGRLADLRANEFAASAQLLGAESVVTETFADGSLVAADPALVTGVIAGAIEEARPSAVLTVADLTGSDTDSQAVAAYALAAAQAPGSGVARVWTVTRGEREASWLDAVADPIVDPARVPGASAAVPVAEHALAKGDVLAVHGTQSPHLVAATYPYADRIPTWAYFRFLDREYFALTWGEPLA